MTIKLVVLKPFSDFKRGDMIADKAIVDSILAGPQARFVVRICTKGG